MIRLSFSRTVFVLISLSLVAIGFPGTAGAGFIGTADYLSARDRAVRIERVQAALLRDDLSARLTALGVDPATARERVGALPDNDLVLLDERLDELPAGGGLLELVVVAFLIILILDLTGLTDIFPGIGPGKVR